ncbi:MAG: hypothetical protein IJ853_02805 [Rickettsiales bacterium]|nr:hypothetical protein [Rickettsiales bacterium]
MAKVEDNIIDDIYADTLDPDKVGVNTDLIPYACYYNSTTILTQNMDLLQTIKIPSFVTNKSTYSFYSLRDDLNATFKKNSKISDNLNFWFQTVRKPVNIIPNNQKDRFFVSNEVMEKWNKYYNWDKQFANEIYITVVISPKEDTLSKALVFLKTLNFTLYKNSKIKEIAEMSKTLDKVVAGIRKDLEKYCVELLTIEKGEDNIYYSQHLKFFSLLITGDRNKVKLPVNELSESLITKKIAYGRNMMQIYSKTESMHVAIISLKYCNSILLSQLDKIIQLNQEMIITQSVSFIDPKQVNARMLKYFEVLSINDDPYILNLSEIGSLLPKTDGEDNRVCLSQIIIQVKAKNKDELNSRVNTLFKVLGKAGIVAVKEDLFMPTLFWSQLPANFNFIKRFQQIPLNNVCNSTSLFNFPTGKISGNYWGDSVIVLKSALETPYFFSFHTDKNGNSLFIGPKSLQKTKYMNLFLLAATKQIKKMIYIDNTNRSRVFINSLNGKYYIITSQNNLRRLTINPFQMEKRPENIEFIKNWLYTIIKRHDDGMVGIDNSETNMELEWQQLEKIIDDRINDIGKIGDVLDIAKQEKFAEIYNVLEKWASPTGYGLIFNRDTTVDLFKDKEDVIGINLNTIVNNEELKIAVFDYILHNIIQKATGEPTILAIDEGWLLFDNSYFADRLSTIFKQLYSKNVAVIMTTSGADSYETSNIQLSVRQIFPTQILLPNLKTTIYQKKIFDISEEESRILSIMKEENGTILIKSNGNTVVSSVNLEFLTEEERTILTSNNLSVNIMLKAKELINSPKAENWLPLMFTLMKNYKKIKFEEKQREQEKRQIKFEEAKQNSDNNAILKA